MKISRIAVATFVLAGLSLMVCAQTPPATSPAAQIPPVEADSVARLGKSTRHGEWVNIKVPGATKEMKTWVVYPERPDKAPVVLCIMEIYGMTDWIRATTDQLAADGFIAIAPNFLSLKDDGAAVASLGAEEVITDLNAARDYGLSLPSTNGKLGVIGFCWGGGKSFAYAVAQPKLNAAVAFYGTPPTSAPSVVDEKQIEKIQCAVAGFFGGSDQRVTSMVAPTQAAMKKLNKSYDAHVYDGAGHGFMRQQTGANLKAAQEAWPLAIKFLTENTK